MTSNAKEKTSNVLHLIKYTTDMPLKLQYLDQFKEILLKNGDSLCSEFFPNLVEFQKDRFSPIRKLLAQYVYLFFLFFSIC